jgi:hypothetical protein
MKQKNPLCFVLGMCMVHVVFWWCTNQKGPSPKGKNQFGITPTTKLTIDIAIFILITH